MSIAQSIEPTSIEDSAYTRRIKLPRYNIPVNVMMATSPRDAARILRKLRPEWRREFHALMAQAHETLYEAAKAAYRQLLDKASQEAFGRSFQVLDYSISGIASEEFSEEHKVALRSVCHAKNWHQAIASAHRYAARY